MSLVACAVVVVGRVQGVGFRRFVQRSAERAGVSGWVGNRPDGSVACEAEGETAAIEQFLQAVQKGPALARVEGCSVQSIEPRGAAGFTIR